MKKANICARPMIRKGVRGRTEWFIVDELGTALDSPTVICSGWEFGRGARGRCVDAASAAAREWNKLHGNVELKMAEKVDRAFAPAKAGEFTEGWTR